MLNRLVGSDSTVAQLREGLDASTRAVRGIAHRVANAGTPDFARALEDAQAAGESEIDLEQEMVALADEQLRYEATATLLQRAYQGLRSAIREG